MSTRKEQAIYGAVHDVIMTLRITTMHGSLRGEEYTPDELDARIAQAGRVAAMAAYRKPLGDPGRQPQEKKT